MISKVNLRSLSPHAIVLDIDETLVHTDTDINRAIELDIFSDPVLRSRAYFTDLTDVACSKGEGQKSLMWGVTRPRIKEFIDFCFSYFRVVGIWSAGKKDYVTSMVEILFRDSQPPHFVYTYDDLYFTESGDYFKPLDKLFKETTIGNYVLPGNVFMIDDRRDVCSYNIDNAIIVPEYAPESLEEIKQTDDTFPVLISWFLDPRVKHCKDIRTLDKDIF
jgi:hypothetical protein